MPSSRDKGTLSGHLVSTFTTLELTSHKNQDKFRDKGWWGKLVQVSLRGPIHQGREVSGNMLATLNEVRPLTTCPDRRPPALVRGTQCALTRYAEEKVDGIINVS